MTGHGLLYWGPLLFCIRYVKYCVLSIMLNILTGGVDRLFCVVYWLLYIVRFSSLPALVHGVSG